MSISVRCRRSYIGQISDINDRLENVGSNLDRVGGGKKCRRSQNFTLEVRTARLGTAREWKAEQLKTIMMSASRWRRFLILRPYCLFRRHVARFIVNDMSQNKRWIV